MKQNKLLTLKDMKRIADDYPAYGFPIGTEYSTHEQLRESAREWINLFEKDLAKQREDKSGDRHIYFWHLGNITGKIEILKRFFNLED